MKKRLATSSKYNAENRYPRYNSFHGLTRDKKSVSEALGTILLLAVAIVLIASVAAWVQTIPELPEKKSVKFDITYSKTDNGELFIDIEHLGGDRLDAYETSVYLTIIYPNYFSYNMPLSDSNNISLSDNYWSIGEHWNYTMYGIPNNAEINIKIKDDNNNNIILDEDILLGELDENLPDLEISADNITFAYDDEFIRKTKPVTISAVIYNRGRTNSSAIVRFFDDNSLIVSGGREFKTIEVPYKHSPSVNNYKRVSMSWIPDRWGIHEIHVKIYSTDFETNYANNYASVKVNVEISVDPPEGPDLALRSYDINPSSKYPMHGNDLNVSIVYHNFGDLPVKPGEVFNISVTLGDETQIKQVSNGLRAKESREFFMLFREIGPGGPANITVELDPEFLITEENKANNIAIKYFQILPTILIVDDDGVDGGGRNVVTPIMKSLTGRGINFDYYKIRGDSDLNPRYDKGARKLINYDIVIWATGYEVMNTLTTANINALTQWLSDNTTTNSLWLIGQDVLNETVKTPGVVNTTDFAYEYLGVGNYGWNGTPEILEGRPGDIITDGMYLNTSDYLPNLKHAANITTRPRTANEETYTILNNETHLGPNAGVALRYHNLTENFKVVLFSYEFTSINSPFEISNVSYHVLKWFNYTISEGYDFGIVDQSFSTVSPNFMDVITISAVIVNNGPDTEEVEVVFYKTGPDGVEKEIGDYPDSRENPRTIIIAGNGGRYSVQKDWLATSVGDHNFRVMVDPNDRFQEIVEENNDFSYFGLEVTKLEIQYTVLIVDDDNSSNNGGLFPDAVRPIVDSLEELNYFYVEEIVSGGLFQGDGPDLDTLKHYNTVIWLTGDDIGPTLTDNDQENVRDLIEGNYVEAKYLETKINFLLVGQNILDDINGSGNNIVPGPGFVRDQLLISRYSTSRTLGNKVWGITNNKISHGSEYPISRQFPDRTDTFIKSGINKYIFYNSKNPITYNSMMYDHPANNSRVMFFSWELSFVDNSTLFTSKAENYRNELIYLIMNHFQYPGDKAELKVTDIDISLSEDNPNTGIAYVLKADIYNYGQVSSSGIVRFYDGDSIIDTDTIYVPAQSKSSAEIVWIPRFAGNRTINVVVDFNNNIAEYFDNLNNHASMDNTWVYFFHDDMESGASNWNHESTILRINGESTLDYLDDPVYTAINSSWAEINGFDVNASEYYSANVSFSASEPSGQSFKADVLLALVIDTSRSMYQRFDSQSRSYLNVSKQAAKYLITQLSDESNVTIWHFQGNEEYRELSFTELDGTGRAAVNKAIDDLDNPSGQTILWDAIGEAYNDVKAAMPYNENLTPAVVVLSDGSDYQAADTSAYQWQKMDSASNEYCPWHNISTYKDHSTHQGKYRWFDSKSDFQNNIYTDYWNTVGGKGSWVGNRSGLLYSDIPIYTIGLGLEHHEPPNVNKTGTWPGDQVSDTNSVYINGTESGTLEYNLWRISKTSEAEYYYSPTSDELRGIFNQIASKLVGVVTRGVAVGDESKHAITGSFSLENITSARLTFYHKYDLTVGYNGAIVRAGTQNSTGHWNYKYLQPTKLYNGNLYLRKTVYDDYNNRILWCWNGISANNLFDWEYAEFDLSEFIGQSDVRLNFSLVLWGGGGGGGWWVDNIEVKVSRGNTFPVTSSSKDQWVLSNNDAHSGSYCWWNRDPSTGYLNGGIDNSLMSRSIDLTNALNVSLSAYFKFNINEAGGRPPDGFRVEISDNNGETWKPINFGSRSSWGVSGNDSDASDGVPGDGKSYTGINEGNYWVEAGSLTRLNCDLSGWNGRVIRIRFRVITASDDNRYFGNQHYQSSTVGFGGFYVDDVIINGFS